MKINQQMSEFQLAQAQKEIVEDVLRVKHVVNTSRNAINNFNKKLGKELHVKTTDNPTLTNLIKDTAKMKKANVHYEPNTSLWYKIDGDTLYIRGHEAEGYSERVLYTDDTLSNNGWAGCTCTEAIIEEQIVPISCVNMFKNCKQLTTIQGLQNIVMNYCTSCHGMFYACNALQSIDCSNWNTSNVTDMSWTFNGCRQLKSIGNLSKWDVSNVVDMKLMFKECCSLDNIGNLNDWNTSNVTDMIGMFSYNWNVYDDNGNAMNKEQYKEELGINNIPTTISIPPIPKDCDISNMFDRQKFIEDIVYCGKISQSFTTKYGVAIQYNMSSLTRESIVKIINALDPENPGMLTLCEPNYEKLTDEDKAIATSKGWTIAA